MAFAFVCEVDCFYTETDSSATVIDGENRRGTKLPQKQATHRRVLEVKSQVYRDTDRKRTNSYQFYSCLQTTIERKKSY